MLGADVLAADFLATDFLATDFWLQFFGCSGVYVVSSLWPATKKACPFACVLPTEWTLGCVRR